MNKNKIVVLLFFLSLIILLAACGGTDTEDSENVSENRGEASENLSLEFTSDTEYFLQDPIPLDIRPTTDTGYNGLQLTEDGIYAGFCSYDAETETLTQMIRFLPDEADPDRPTPAESHFVMDLKALPVSFDYAEAKWHMDTEGNLFAAVVIGRESQMTLGGVFKFSSDGTLLMQNTAIGASGIYNYGSSLTVNQDGTLFLLVSSGEPENEEMHLLLFQENGNYKEAAVSEGNLPYQLARGKDGDVYAAVTDSQGNRSLVHLDNTGKVLETWNDFPAAEGSRLVSDTPSSFLYTSGNGVCRYDLQTRKSTRLFSWMDYNILPSQVSGIFSDVSGTVSVVQLLYETISMSLCRFLPGDPESSEASSPEAPAKDVPEKLVVGSLYESISLRNAVYEFNKSQSDYQVVIESYLPYNTDYEEVNAQIDHLRMDLATGNKDFDLINLDFMDANDLNDLGLLEDLYPYLDQGETVDREDVFEAVLNAYTLDGKLISLPHTFSILCLAGKQSLLGSRTGWTLRELLDFAKAHPDARIFSSPFGSSAVTYTLFYGTDSFIFMENNVPVFDTELCKDLLEMIKNTTDLPNPRPKSTPEMLQAEEALLTLVSVQDFTSLQLYKAFFAEEPITLIGFPTPDGKNGNLFETSFDCLLSILSTSSHKEGAWAFLEYCLINGGNGGGVKYVNGGGFPTLKADFEEEAQKALNDQYQLDEKGRKIFDEDGNPKLKRTQTYETDGWEYQYTAIGEDNIEMIRTLLSSGAHPRRKNSDVLTQIFEEESAAYFSGQKSLEDTVDVIQSRMMLYYSETLQ